MNQVKIFRVEGEIRRPGYQTNIRREIRALKPEDAIEKIYAEIGSQHRVKRFHIKIINIKEIKPEEAENNIVRELSGVEKNI